MSPEAKKALLGWFERAGRDLPWRSTRDPWSILVSEIMLQQTQAIRVADRLGSFLERFPDARTMAASSPASVIEAWHGLGYNRRAVALHRCATAIATTHLGAVPEDLDALLELPGIGPYTARAIRVFAFGLDDAVVDVNVSRVVQRTGGARLSPGERQRRADELVPPGLAWEWNQAMIELGATHCRAEPFCDGCPLADECRWWLKGRPTPDPAAPVAARPSPFEGSDRQARGRLVAHLRAAALEVNDAGDIIGWPDDEPRCARIVDGLLTDGLIVEIDGRLQLPGPSGDHPTS